MNFVADWIYSNQESYEELGVQIPTPASSQLYTDGSTVPFDRTIAPQQLDLNWAPQSPVAGAVGVEEVADANDTNDAEHEDNDDEGNAAVVPPAGEAKRKLSEEEKRKLSRERNKIAASKCRKRKKEWAAALEVELNQANAAKAELARTVGKLQEEILYLKGIILRHSDCQCAGVQEYINQQVKAILFGQQGRDSAVGVAAMGQQQSP